MCIYVCVWGCLDKYISVATWPPQTKISGSAPAWTDSGLNVVMSDIGMGVCPESVASVLELHPCSPQSLAEGLSMSNKPS